MITTSAPWEKTPPTVVGSYHVYCDEVPDVLHPVAIFAAGGMLWVKDADVGTYPLESYHYNLTNIEWRRITESL